MQEEFVVPLTKEEFIKKAEPVTIVGAKSVKIALEKELEKVTTPLQAEIDFFDQVIEYKETGELPEGLK